MYSWDDPKDRVTIMQMNEDLRGAHLELLSAHCATHQLRLRYSLEDLAHFGQRDVLRKSVETASALNHYYASLDTKIPREQPVSSPPRNFTEAHLPEAVRRVSAFLREQRERYLPSAVPLPQPRKAIMWPYFSPELLDQVRIVELHGERLPNPPFYQEAKSLGFVNLPEFTHMESLTFLDVVVFNQTLTERALFHALVHVVQFQVLGVERYTELFVRGFVDTKFHFTVPLEAQAFSLESRFARPRLEKFSVEDQVRLWLKMGRY
jgi:hypothetical protein